MMLKKAELTRTLRPPLLHGAGAQLLYITGHGLLDLVQIQDPSSGFYERTEYDDCWEHSCEFHSWPNLDFKRS
jgi:hypothetical protein